MIKIYEDIHKRFFIYDNVIDNHIYNSIFNEIHTEKHNETQNVRFSIENIKTGERISINQKLYKDLSVVDKKLFDKNYDNNDEYVLLRRDSDIILSYELRESINTKISDIINDIYKTNTPNIEYSSIIEYGPGYLMRIHSDSTPHNPRLCTAVLYCNDMIDGDVGGDVLFYDNEDNQQIIYTYKPKKNQLIVFDSEFNKVGIPHSVTKIENWNRYVYRVYYKTPTH
jgi:Rps23 Pro-64 3,4-dihydroxylase Tpa1-like proline 4-hydroxylase